jgi:hypothetical protein
VTFNQSSVPTDLMIYNLVGQLLLAKKAESNIVSLNLFELPKGIYLLKIVENGIVLKTLKIVKE